MTSSDYGYSFTALAAEAAAGRLRLENTAATQCADACTEYIFGLRQLQDHGQDLVNLDAYGTLASAQMLGQKFADLATGAEGSFVSVLQQHIDVVTQMRDMFVKAGIAYEQAHADHTRSITSAGDHA